MCYPRTSQGLVLSRTGSLPYKLSFKFTITKSVRAIYGC